MNKIINTTQSNDPTNQSRLKLNFNKSEREYNNVIRIINQISGCQYTTVYSGIDRREININENLSEKDVMGILYGTHHNI